MAITPRNGDLTAGVAGSWTDTIDPSPASWLTGDNPPAVTTDGRLAAAGFPVHVVTTVEQGLALLA